MARRLLATLALALAAGAALPAQAATLLAPPVLVLEDDQIAQCNATNTSDKKPLEVKIELFDDDGVVLGTSTLTLAPLNTRSFGSDPGPGLAVGCRISFSGGAKKVRGTLMLIRTGVGVSEVLDVLPVE